MDSSIAGPCAYAGLLLFRRCRCMPMLPGLPYVKNRPRYIVDRVSAIKVFWSDIRLFNTCKYIERRPGAQHSHCHDVNEWRSGVRVWRMAWRLDARKPAMSPQRIILPNFDHWLYDWSPTKLTFGNNKTARLSYLVFFCLERPFVKFRLVIFLRPSRRSSSRGFFFSSVYCNYNEWVLWVLRNRTPQHQ